MSSKKRSAKGSRAKTGEFREQLLNGRNIKDNHRLVHAIRIYSSIASGCGAGILDLKGVDGLILFAVVYVVSTAIILDKMSFEPSKYFPNWFAILDTSLSDSIASFLLFWTYVTASSFDFGNPQCVFVLSDSWEIFCICMVELN